MKFKKGDEVLVTAGKNKTKRGKLEAVLARQHQVIIANINVSKRHVKKQEGGKGGIIDIVKPLPMASIALICPKCKKPTRVGYLVSKGEKHRICKKCGAMV
jgi:large subunit ribosomal protein L24